MFAHCIGPIWELDDFSRCFELDYLQTLFPLILCGASLLYLSIQLLREAKNSKYYHAYTLLDHPAHVWSLRTRDTSAVDDEDEFEERDEFLSLRRTMSRGQESVIEVDRPKGEFLLVVIEELGVLAELGIHLVILIKGGHNIQLRIAAAAGVATWTYIAAIASVRLFLSGANKASFPKLWYHTAFLYSLLWIMNILLFRSAIIHSHSSLGQNLRISDFAINTLLLVIALTSRKGNRAVKLEYEGDLEPSHEQTASVLSLATFGWVDAIVWKGYKKTYELADVWNLAPKDKAAAILEDYRQLRTTNILAWHLLRYFRRGLLIQAAWACLSGFLTFAPTLLLKAILEYVERPDLTPRNAVWFYVILLFVAGCTSALADGQALWVGRKVCLRLKAIIIGELYAKALKRKAAAGADKVLGEEKKGTDKAGDQSKKSKGGLLATLGLKKKSKSDTTNKEVSSDSSDQVTSGAIINLMAVDSFKVAEISAYLHFLWANTPVQVVVAIVLLYRILGYSSIAGIGMMFVLLPINLFISKRFASIQKQILAATDARIHTTNEVLNNIRIIKYFAWEQRFMGQVDEKRSLELYHLRRRYIWWAAAATIWSGTPVLITFLSFLVYTVVEGKDLIPSIAFTALSLFQILRMPLDQLADMVAHVQESKVSVDRIEEYLSEPETDKYRLLKDEELDDDGEPIIGFDHGTFTWGNKDGSDEDAFKMIHLDLRFHVSQLNVIVGPTGCGKTSLLMALLGEMTAVSGKVYLPGGRSREDLKADPETGFTESVAYCAQQAWLVNDTIKENIVFASPWDPQRYKNVLVACSLQRDLEILDAGDQTLVGEKGVTLSGGQKQRISLARALYSKARHVLLDDVLSAVDSHTAKWIFEKALMGPLMYNRTCILVTHNQSLCLPHSEYAVVLDNGRVVASGSANEVIASGKLSEDLSKSWPNSRFPSTVPSRVPSDVGGEEAMGEVLSRKGTNGMANGDIVPNGTANGLAKKDTEDSPKGEHKETKAEGGVKIGIILMYLKAMGSWPFWLSAATVFAAQQISSVATNVWIRNWANAYASKQYHIMDRRDRSPLTHISGISGLGTCMTSGTCAWDFPWTSRSRPNSWEVSPQMILAHDSPDVNSTYYLGIYAVLGLVFMAITLAREGVLFGGSLAASRRIHQRLMERVTHAQFRFFDQTPLGQLMNRFSKDIESVDQEIAPVAVGVIYCLASIITIVILISVITPGFLIAGVFISILYFLIGKFYINSSRDLKRLESVQRSPLYQQFGETLSGMTTIRAYGDERRFIRENLARVNTYNRPFIYLWAANRWLAFRVDVVGAMVSFFSGVFVVLSVSTIDAGAAGLALTYAVTFTENVLWFVRLYSANEQNMNSVERIKEYMDVDQEAASVIPETKPATNWPSKGSVEFIGYSTRYRKDFDLVLKKLTFKIMPGEKVGIVGRTGAGKSSLALALFRALEAEEGKVLIDDVDVGLIGLQDLRENIVMVPQDPTLFTGTVRSNLDPFGLFTDEEIFTALRRVHLIGSAFNSAAPTQPTTPDTTVRDDPMNAAITTDTSEPQTSEPSHAAKAVTIHPSTMIAEDAPNHLDAEVAAQAAKSNGSTPLPSGAVANVQPDPIADNKNPFRSLSSPVTESGSNLSQGQRQLLCLARALLKNPKILLMDEATASIDYATDAKIQETIREIRNTTITIAHRLQTIIDYDKVLVLDKGEVVEYGAPWELVETEGGMFRGMCEISGEMESLREEAKKAEEARKLVDKSNGEGSSSGSS